MALKERLMQERNEARQEKVRLEEEIVCNLFSFFNSLINYHSQADTSKRYDEQEKENQLLKKYILINSSSFNPYLFLEMSIQLLIKSPKVNYNYVQCIELSINQ
jgi:hypothetical protein